jgi:hypothetical protein
MSSWTDHVKDYAKKHSVSYKEAMSSAKSTYTKSTKAKEPKMKEAGEAKMPGKKKKNQEQKEEMPDMVSKPQKREKLVVKYEKEKRVESAEAKGKKKKGAVLM